MSALFITVCLLSAPETCVERLIPGACEAAHAEAWVTARPDLRLQDWDCAPLDSRFPLLPVSEAAPGLFVHQGQHALPDRSNAGDTANLGFIIGRDAVAVIDAGGARQIGEQLYATLRQKTTLPVRWLILTHMHPDHIMGASAFVDAGAQVLVHERFPAALAARADVYLDRLTTDLGAELAIGSEIVAADAVVSDRLQINLGARSLLIEAHPVAHTDNDLTILDETSGTWWLSDLLFDGHLPSVDGSILGWRALMDELTERPTAQVIPGHGGPVLPWPEGAAPMLAYFDALIAQTREALQLGESLGTALTHLGHDLGDGWELFETFNPLNATASYLELEWE